MLNDDIHPDFLLVERKKGLVFGLKLIDPCQLMFTLFDVPTATQTKKHCPHSLLVDSSYTLNELMIKRNNRVYVECILPCI